MSDVECARIKHFHHVAVNIHRWFGNPRAVNAQKNVGDCKGNPFMSMQEGGINR
jgi:hypothetical protein